MEEGEKSHGMAHYSKLMKRLFPQKGKTKGREDEKGGRKDLLAAL